MTTKLSVKIAYAGDIRKAKLNRSEGFSGLLALFRQLFGDRATDNVKIRYKDEDGDMVLICTDEEVAEALRHADQQGKVLKLIVSDVAEKKKRESPMPVPIADSPKNKTASAPEVDDFYVIQDENGGSNGHGKTGDDRKIEQKDAREIRRQAKQADRQAKQAEKEIRRQAKHAEKAARRQEKYARRQAKEERKNDGQRWREHARQKRKEARSAFHEEIKNFLGDAKVIGALQAALPFAADKLLKNEDSLKTIMMAVLEQHAVLKNHPLIQRLLPLVQSFLDLIPTNVFGPVILDVVLDLQGLIRDGKLDMPIPRLIKRICCMVKRSVRRMTPEVHYGVVCDKCNTNNPIVGNRWKLVDSNYDLCDTCYNELNEDEKKNFNKVEPHGWRPPSAFGIPGFHPGPFAFMNLLAPFAAAFGGGRGFGGGGCGGFGGRGFGGGGCGGFGGRGFGGFGPGWQGPHHHGHRMHHGHRGHHGWRRHFQNQQDFQSQKDENATNAQEKPENTGCGSGKPENVEDSE